MTPGEFLDQLRARVSISRVTKVAAATAPRRADAPLPDAMVLRAAFRSALSAWPQATHVNSVCERREALSARPPALQVCDGYAGSWRSVVGSCTHEREQPLGWKVSTLL